MDALVQELLAYARKKPYLVWSKEDYKRIYGEILAIVVRYSFIDNYDEFIPMSMAILFCLLFDDTQKLRLLQSLLAPYATDEWHTINDV